MPGPLEGLTVVEIGGVGPVPIAGQLLADLGVSVVRIEPPSATQKPPELTSRNLLNRGKQSIVVDLKQVEGVGIALDLVASADAALEGFRPGVAERLGIGPDACTRRNPRLVYGRMTGWGQDGPLSHLGGHDINYIALSGALHTLVSNGERPRPPLNLLGDVAGGGMLLALGVLAGVIEAQRSGSGQVVDSAMVDGSAALLTMMLGLAAAGRGDRLAMYCTEWYYNVYETADGGFVSVGAVEPKFRAELQRILADHDVDSGGGAPVDSVERAQAVFRSKSRSAWERIFAGKDACFAPVLTVPEAARHPHLAERRTYIERDGVLQPAPAPRFGRTPGQVTGAPPAPAEHTAEVLAGLGYAPSTIESLRTRGIIT